jgi:hypothetical protein
MVAPEIVTATWVAVAALFVTGLTIDQCPVAIAGRRSDLVDEESTPEAS